MHIFLDIAKGKWFSFMDCKRIHNVLQNLPTQKPEDVDGNLSTFMRDSNMEKIRAL